MLIVCRIFNYVSILNMVSYLMMPCNVVLLIFVFIVIFLFLVFFLFYFIFYWAQGPIEPGKAHWAYPFRPTRLRPALAQPNSQTCWQGPTPQGLTHTRSARPTVSLLPCDSSTPSTLPAASLHSSTSPPTSSHLHALSPCTRLAQHTLGKSQPVAHVPTRSAPSATTCLLL